MHATLFSRKQLYLCQDYVIIMLYYYYICYYYWVFVCLFVFNIT